MLEFTLSGHPGKIFTAHDESVFHALGDVGDDQSGFRMVAPTPAPKIRQRNSSLVRTLEEAGKPVPYGLRKGEPFRKGFMGGQDRHDVYYEKVRREVKGNPDILPGDVIYMTPHWYSSRPY
jgi:hypothetical protein